MERSHEMRVVTHEQEIKIVTTLIDPAKVQWEDWREDVPARVKLLLSGGRTPSAELTLGMVSLEPGHSLPAHTHRQAEACIVLSGSGECEVDGTVNQLQAGQVVFIPGNAAHRISNTDEVQLVFLFAYAADSFDHVSHVFGAREADQADGHKLQALNDPALNNPDATPGTGMLPDLGSNDPNSQPSG